MVDESYKPVVEDMPEHVQDAVGELVSTIDKHYPTMVQQRAAMLGCVDLASLNITRTGDEQVAARPVGDLSKDSGIQLG
ncbi:MAG: hypothetical protein ACOYNL_06100 [Rickettsiales bacterium]